MLKSLAACIVLVLVGGLVALSTGASSASTRDVPPSEVPQLPRIAEHLEASAVRESAQAAAAAAARERARRIRRLLAERRAAAQRAARAAYRKRLLINSSAEAWANTPFAIRVANCESGDGPGDTSPTYNGDPYLRDPNGHYGKWQFDPETWWSVGGTGNAADASVSEQDYRAWLLWKREGWAPWECASLVG